MKTRSPGQPPDALPPSPDPVESGPGLQSTDALRSSEIAAVAFVYLHSFHSTIPLVRLTLMCPYPRIIRERGEPTGVRTFQAVDMAQPSMGATPARRNIAAWAGDVWTEGH